MDVDSESCIVREVPAWIIRIIVDYDRVRVPDPVGYIGKVDRGYAPVPIVKPEPVRATSGQVPDMAGPETPSIMAVFPRTIQAKTRVMAVVAYPVVGTGIYMGRVRMTGLIVKITMFFMMFFMSGLPVYFGAGFRAMRRGRGGTRIRRWAVRRNIAMANIMSTGRMFLGGMSTMLVAMLAKCDSGLQKKGS